MQLASHGLRGLPGQQASRFLSSGIPSRSIHIPSSSVPRPAQSSGLTQKLFSKTRTLLSGFIGHLTTPGTLRASPGSAPIRSLHSARPQTIQQRLSLPSRYALSTPLNAPRLPRAPAVPRSVTQVGLGTARNFSTARPIFQNLVQNVPVAGRAFCEADWEIKMHEQRSKAKMQMSVEGKKGKKGKEMMKPKEKKQKNTAEADLEHYFPAPAAPDVVTYLLVPLAPTPTTRMPLQASGAPSRLLPLDSIASMHASHHTHSLRVSSLFARLDTAHVWEKGVKCSAFGDPSGTCTVLKIEFDGWTMAMVRGVIGESGSGWCEMEEVNLKHNEEDEMESVLSDMSGVSSGIASNELGEEHMESNDRFEDPWANNSGLDPATSFVLPTLDFSSSFYAASRQSVVPPFTPPSSGFSTPISDDGSHVHFALSPRGSEHGHDIFSDFDDRMSIGSDSDQSSDFGSWIDPPSVSPGLSPHSQASSWVGGFGFSSEFANRIGDNSEPREAMF